MTQIGRNQPCPCGSGKRYKHCCGVQPATVAATPAAGAPSRDGVGCAVRPAMRPDLPALMQRALVCQKDGKLAAAEALYREALALDPVNFDALHMLGVVRLQLGDPVDGARQILRAIRNATVEYPPLRANLALCLCAMVRRHGILDEPFGAAQPSSDDPRIHFATDIPGFAAGPPLVSVLMHNVDDSGLRSLRRQTYPRLEHLAAPTLNACARQARGDYVAPLGPGDEYDTDRIELMTRLLCFSGSRWGFSGVRFADAAGRQVCFGDDDATDEQMRRLDEIHVARSLTGAFLQFNHAIAAGNLLVERGLWDELGGMRQDSPDPAWDFCVRASLVAPPAILYEPKYTRHIGLAADAARSGGADAAKLSAMRVQWRSAIRAAFSDRPHELQRILAAQYVREWLLLEGGRVHDVEMHRLIALAQELVAGPQMSTGGAQA